MSPAVVREARPAHSFTSFIREKWSHWSTCHSRSTASLPALLRSASSMRSESQTRSTSTTSSCSRPSSSLSTTRSPRLASSAVQVSHLGGGTSGHQVLIVTQDRPLNRQLGCSSQRRPELKEVPGRGEAMGLALRHSRPQEGAGQVHKKLSEMYNSTCSTKGWGKILQVLLDPTQSYMLYVAFPEPLTHAHTHVCTILQSLPRLLLFQYLPYCLPIWWALWSVPTELHSF